ncbi:MAG: HRDC domain-containing protein [bacterium]|nr:HRDC domain-containing protein [bacterium]
MNYTYIDSGQKLSTYIENLAENKTEMLALDIEGESNLHQYGEKLCLVQLYDGKDAVIIDPFKTSMKELKKILENRSILKIMFDAPGDRAFLYKNCRIDTMSILDIQAAVLLLEYEKRDLSSVLKQALQIDTKKSKKKFQQYNWNTRPLSDRAIEYALEDVIHLFELKDLLLSELVEQDLLERFILKNLQGQNKPHIYNKKPKLLRSRNFRELTTQEQGVFKKLFEIRENNARKLNCPPHYLLPNDLLFTLVTLKKKLQSSDFGKRIPPRDRQKIIPLMQQAINKDK